jgi:hypothetical protein
MRKAIATLFALFCGMASASALAAQSYVSVPPQQCVWHAGDDPAWAAANLDESGWQPYSKWKLDPSQPHYWVRCRADLSPLQGLEHPSIQVTLYAAYELYLDDARIGGAGSLRSGFFSMDAIRAFPAPASNFGSGPVTLAVRIAYRFSDLRYGGGSLQLPAAEPYLVNIEAGDASVLRGARADAVWTRIPGSFIPFLYDGILGILGCVLLGQYLQDRGRLDLLLLSLNSIGVAAISVRALAASALVNWPVWLVLGIYATCSLVVNCAMNWFYFALAGRRLPWLFRVVIAVMSLRLVLIFPGIFLPLSSALPFSANLFPLVVPASLLAGTIAGFAPFAAFWPLNAIARRMLPLALLCMALGVVTIFFFLTEPGMVYLPLFGITPGTLMRWHGTAGYVYSYVSFGVLISLMGLLSRDQQRTAQERAALAGEMQAARRVQQYLIPEQPPTTPGFAIQSQYLPAREVGGDFFQVLTQPGDGGVLIVVGDVAGKGVQAGMLAALIVGAIRTAASFMTDPERILALLNERLRGRGLVTCVALRIEPGGAVTLANAGHLPPYLNGRELVVEGSLPLGAVLGIDFPPAHFQLGVGDRLTLVTDGVVEARNAHGELFGFERTAKISSESAESIARAASTFGQEDDITVLTLTWLALAEPAPAVATHLAPG